MEEANKIFIKEQTKEITTFCHHPGITCVTGHEKRYIRTKYCYIINLSARIIMIFVQFEGTVTSKFSGPKCVGAGGVCKFFYDSAPSGTYGTISYLIRGACKVLDCIPNDGDIECKQM